MWYILIGLLGFGFMLAAEYFSQRSAGLLKPLLWVVSIACLTYALVMAWVASPQLVVPPPLVTVAWVGLFCFGGLFIYSVFLEVPFRASYLERSDGARLVTGGTYALTRHPGVLWTAGWLLAAVIVSKSQVLAWAFPFWIAADILLVYVEEKVNLEKAFGQEYREYQKTTPMLFPNRTSFLRFYRMHLSFFKRNNG